MKVEFDFFIEEISDTEKKGVLEVKVDIPNKSPVYFGGSIGPYPLEQKIPWTDINKLYQQVARDMTTLLVMNSEYNKEIMWNDPKLYFPSSGDKLGVIEKAQEINSLIYSK